MTRMLLSMLFFVVHLPSVPGQTIQFDVFFKGKDIGNIEANIRTTDTVTNYRVNSDVEYNSLLYDYQRTTVVSSSFKIEGHNMLACKSKLTKYGELEEYKVTRWKNGVYECYSNDGSSFTLDTSITFTAGMLYFKEPKGLPHVFSESYQALCPVRKIKSGTYELSLPGGKRNHYIYEDGKLQEVKVFRSFINLSFKRK